MVMMCKRFPPTGALFHRFSALPILAFIVFVSVVGPKPATAATIFVTTTQQKIGESGGCSLQEAIWASRLRQSVAIKAYDLDNNYQFAGTEYVATQCAAGDGNDVIVLPSRSVLQLNYPVSDADNYLGPTATPMIASNITIEGYGATLSYVPSCFTAFTGTPCPRPEYAYLFRAFSVGPLGVMRQDVVTVHSG